MGIKTFIIDDTVTYRKILSDVVAGFPELELIGSAPSGVLALKKLALTPADLVLCDVHMPDMDGVETLENITKLFPKTLVVMVSGETTRGADTTIKALQMGAVDFIRKPEGNNFEHNIEQLRTDLRPVVRLVSIRLSSIKTMVRQALTPVRPLGTASTLATNAQTGPTLPPPSNFAILAIGVSTGGPEALGKFIPMLPQLLPVPVVLVQHMPPMFTKSLADSLDKKSQLRVVEAAEGDRIEKGNVYIAPGGKHMILRETAGTIMAGLNDNPPENSCRPSVDVLFRSVASVYGSKGILSVILSGMGNDGMLGVRTMKRKGCFSITQSEATCVVYGMPRAVDEAGLSDKSMPLLDIAGEISRLLKCK